MSILIKNVCVKYGETSVIKDVSTSFPEGKITVILGPNGSGKTTLLKAIGNNIKLSSGNIFIDGKSIKDYKSKELAKTISYLPQFHHTPSTITVEELVSYGRNPYLNFLSKLTKKDIEIVDWALEVTNLKEYRERTVTNLSGGERQRVWIAMMLAKKTKYILLDEPLNNLDICYQIEVLEMLKSLNEKIGVTIILVLHDINYALRYADNIVVMKDGIVYDEGYPKKIINKVLMRDVFKTDCIIQKIGNHYWVVPQKLSETG